MIRISMPRWLLPNADADIVLVGRLLCASWDDFMVVKLAHEARKAIQQTLD
jgi:hypothetical protein